VHLVLQALRQSAPLLPSVSQSVLQRLEFSPGLIQRSLSGLAKRLAFGRIATAFG
jgi:hypothetical protein